YPMMVDSQLNQISQLGIEFIFSAANMQGMAVHDSGSLLYSSTNYGVDIIDVKHGALAERILLNGQDAFLDGSLAVDENGESIFLPPVRSKAALSIQHSAKGPCGERRPRLSGRARLDNSALIG